MTQMSLFDGTQKFTINKPIRLIELFAGYGSQHFALEYLGIPFESWRICEWAVKSIQAYKDLHFGDDDTDYSKDMEYEEIVKFLAHKGISANYDEPMTEKQIRHLGENKCRQIYNNIRATHNMVNVMQVHAEDLDIVDTDKYCYMLTYSFPCQDLSRAGYQKGMSRDSGTRSGMLWQVERILDECTELPQVLVMENVPDVIGTKNISHFAEWAQKLESLGYHNYWKVLNAKHYGVPQSRERCFMVSVLGDYYYEFPNNNSIDVVLQDIVEQQVDEKYYLPPDFLKKTILRSEEYKQKNFSGDKSSMISGFTTRQENLWCSAMLARCDNFYGVDDNVYKDVIGTFNYDTSDNFMRNKSRFTEKCDIFPCLTTVQRQGIVFDNYKVRKLTPRESWRLMGVKDEDFDKIANTQSGSSLNHLAGDSIVVNVLMAIFKPMFE